MFAGVSASASLLCDPSKGGTSWKKYFSFSYFIQQPGKTRGSQVYWVHQCVCLCVCVWERERDRETERQRDRDRERQRQRETETERDRNRDRSKQKSVEHPCSWLYLLLSIPGNLSPCHKHSLSAPVELLGFFLALLVHYLNFPLWMCALLTPRMTNK